MKSLANSGFTLSVKTMMMMTMTMMVMTLMMVMLTVVMLLSSRNLRYQNIFAKLFGQLFNWHLVALMSECSIQFSLHYQVRLAGPNCTHWPHQHRSTWAVSQG